MDKPRKFGAPPKRAPRPGERFQIGIRVTPELKRKLDAAAEESGRSQSQEAEIRLEQSFERDRLMEAFKRLEILIVGLADKHPLSEEWWARAVGIMARMEAAAGGRAEAPVRTRHPSNKGIQLHAVRDKKGQFEDIQTFKRTSGRDEKRWAKVRSKRVAGAQKA